MEQQDNYQSTNDEETGFDAAGRVHGYRKSCFERHRRVWWISLAVLVVVAISVAIALSVHKNSNDDNNPNSNENALVAAVSLERMKNHLSSLDDIAGLPSNFNSRAIQFGYNASGEYVINWLKANTNLVVTPQYFPVSTSLEPTPPVLTVLTPDPVAWGLNILKASEDYITIMYSGPSAGTLENRRVHAIVGGCADSDFSALSPGDIVLVDKRTDTPQSCNYYVDKLRNAFRLGASAALVYDSWGVSGTPTPLVMPSPTQGRFSGNNSETRFPVFGLSIRFATIMLKITSLGIPLNVTCSSSRNTQMTTTFNVIAETRNGRDDAVVMLGSHLDSVPAGPGINDNGSGSSANLELATIFSQTFPNGLINKVRFAWWAAEEIGLVGSYAYLQMATQAQRDNIALNINFDMLGSGNYYMGIHDGSQANKISTRNASAIITSYFQRAFTSQGIQYKLINMGGGSDYYPFIQYGIPAGGLATGAGSIKTYDDRRLFGGVANAANDPCYHQSCDSYSGLEGSNVDFDVLHQNTRVAADVLTRLASVPDLRTLLGPRQTQFDATLSPDTTMDAMFPMGASNREDFHELQ